MLGDFPIQTFTNGDFQLQLLFTKGKNKEASIFGAPSFDQHPRHLPTEALLLVYNIMKLPWQVR